MAQYEHLSLKYLFFFRPSGAKLFKVVKVPDVEDRPQLILFLDTKCQYKRNDNWFFKSDDESIDKIGDELVDMNIYYFFIEPENE